MVVRFYRPAGSDAGLGHRTPFWPRGVTGIDGRDHVIPLIRAKACALEC